MIYGGAGYRLMLLLHILSVLVGFGPWMLNGVLPARAAKLSDGESRVVNLANFTVSRASQFGMYAALIFGMGTLGLAKKHTIDFSDAWVSVSLVLWIAIIGVLHGLVLPAQRQLGAGEGDRAKLTQRQSLGVSIINLLVIVVVVLMIFEPGGPKLPYS